MPRPPSPDPSPQEALARILEILDHGRLMTVATLRPDGWPQATVVNYLADGLVLYFLVARESQKVANIARDPRVAIALGSDAAGTIAGLSMAGRAAEINDPDKIAALNRRIWRAPEDERFSPHPSSHAVALMMVRPVMLSLIDYRFAGAKPWHFAVEDDGRLSPVTP